MLNNKQKSNLMMTSTSACFIGCALVFLSVAPASAATPTVFATCPQLFEVNGLAATQNKVLFTTQSQPSLYQIDSSGTTCTLFAVVPPPINRASGIVEEYIAISSGLGGFPAGWIYVNQYEKIFKISPDGSSVSLFATIPAFSNHINSHGGVTFDQSGNYGNKLIVTGQDNVDGHGEVFTVDSAGNATKLVDLGGTSASGITEGPQVTLATFSPAPSRLLVTQEILNIVWVVNPDGSTRVLNNLSDIAGTNVIPANVCTLVPANASYFVTDWVDGRILKYAAGDVPAGGGVLMPVEGTTPTASIYLEDNSGAISIFDSNQFVAGVGPIVHEGSTFVTCNAGTACPLSPGYWKKHAYPATMTFPVIIGGISYSKTDFNTILNNPGGGNAVQILGFQLAAALLNIANGANVPNNVASTIANAENLLSGISLLSGNVAPSSPLGQLMVSAASVLNTYNNTECSQ